MSSITSSTTTTTGYIVSADTTGTLNILTGSTPTSALYIDASGNVSIPIGNLTLSGTGSRITGDFSTLTIANRPAFQSSTANGSTAILALPNGTSTDSSFQSFNNSDPTNAARTTISTSSTESSLQAGRTGTGNYLPLTFYSNNTTKLTIAADTTGTFIFGGTAPRITGDFSNATLASRLYIQSSTVNGVTNLGLLPNGTGTSTRLNLLNTSDTTNYSVGSLLSTTADFRIISDAAGTGTQLPMTFYTNGIEQMRIGTNGFAYIGMTATPASVGNSYLYANTGVTVTNNGATTGYFQTYNSLAAADKKTWRHAGLESGDYYFQTINDAYNAATERLRISAAGNIGVAVSVPTARIHLPAGATTANGAPLKFTSGSVLTTPENGTIEFDGIFLYHTANTINGRQLVTTPNYYVLSADATAVGSTIATFFPGTTSIPLITNGIYEIEFNCWFTKTTAGTLVWTLANSTTVTKMHADMVMSPITGVTSTNATSELMAQLANQTGASVAFAATGSLTTGVNHFMRMRVYLVNGASTSLRLQVTNSAGTVTPLGGSYWKATRIGSVGTFAA